MERYETCGACLRETESPKFGRCPIHTNSDGSTDWTMLYRLGEIDRAEWADQTYRRARDEILARADALQS